MEKQSGYLPLVKHVANAAGHQLPFGVGSILSLISAANRVGDRDYLGAGLDTVSGLTSWMPFIGTPISLSADLVNLSRDIKSSLSEPDTDSSVVTASPQNSLNPTPAPRPDVPLNLQNRSANIILPGQKIAAENKTNFSKDIEDKNSGQNSSFYKNLNPLIVPNFNNELSGDDADRVNYLKDEVRKGLVSLDYLTGHKKNLAESFYDVNPVAAVGLDALKKAPVVGAGVAGIGVLENLRRQRKNMNLSEPAKMSRTENPLDRTNPMELLNPSDKKPVRSDVADIFGDFDGSSQKRLQLIDRMSGGSEGSFTQQFEALSTKQKEIAATGEQKILDLRNKLKEKLEAASSGGEAPKGPKGRRAPKGAGGALAAEIKRLEGLVKNQTEVLEQEMRAVQTAKDALIQKAKNSSGNTALQKYVNLHESLRRSGGKLQGYIGEGLGPLSGISDLAQKYHITAASPNFDKGLLTTLAQHHGGAQASPKQLEKFLGSTLTDLADTSLQGSGIRRFLKRNKYPLIGGGLLAVAGGLYPFIRKTVEDQYSKSKVDEWKKTILRARGDYDAVQALEEQEAAQAQEDLQNQQTQQLQLA
jgi:hypothetical protein